MSRFSTPVCYTLECLDMIRRIKVTCLWLLGVKWLIIYTRWLEFTDRSILSVIVEAEQKFHEEQHAVRYCAKI